MTLLLNQIDENFSTISAIIEEGTDVNRTVKMRLRELVETGFVRVAQSDSKFSFR